MSHPLVAEAKKYATAKEFCHAFSIDNMHGRYWHITDKPDFSIKRLSPRDLSTLAGGGTGELGLMVSSNPEHWQDVFPSRRHIAEIDLSKAKPDKDYNIVRRGFGHEVFVKNLDAVSVKKVYPIKKGMAEYRRYFKQVSTLMDSQQKCEGLWKKWKHHAVNLL